MKIKEFSCYRAFYCGLCKTLKKRYGFISTFALNYDLAALAILYKALRKTEDPAEFKKCSCAFCPFKKNICALETEALEFSSDVLMLLTGFKIADNKRDNGDRLKGFFAGVFFGRAFKKAKKKNLFLYELIKEGIDKNNQAEMENAGVDEASAGSSLMLGNVFSLLSGDKEKNRFFGMMLGRFIYIADAFDDLSRDIKKGNFNPLKGLPKEERERLLLSSAEVLKRAYSELEIYDMKGVLDNLFFLGTMETAQEKIQKGNKEINERPL